MAINADKPHLWKADVERSIDFYNDWFEPGYLGYEAAEGIDWVWEHRLSDLTQILGSPTGEGVRGKPSFKEVTPPTHAAPPRELRRLVLQQQIDALSSSNERNQTGQFSTPLPLAVEMIVKAGSYLPGNAPLRFLEPACGTGAFFSATSGVVAPDRWQSRVGVEFDPSFAQAARELWASEGVSIIEGSFIDFSALPQNRGRFNLLCTNPPYVRHHHLGAMQKEILQARVERELGIRASGLTGLYVYFVLLSHNVIEEGGIACWLIPSEFMSVNYGEALRRYLTTRVTLLDIFQFDPEAVQFDDALVSSCVVTYRKAIPLANHKFDFRYGGSFVESSSVDRIGIEGLNAHAKWRFRSPGNETATGLAAFVVGDFFEVRRGIATGANDFFLMTVNEAAERHFPKQFLRPVLTSPRYLTSDIVEADENGIPMIAERRFLLDCNEPPEDVARNHPKLWAYLEEGRSSGIADGYLCQSRGTWYYQERRPPALFLVSYMGRSTVGRERPFRFFLNRSRAIATNGFLNLYPRPAVAAAIKSSPERAEALLTLLNSIPGEVAIRNGRSYGGGLHKMEPRELLSLPLPQIPEWLRCEAKAAQLALI